LWLVVFVAFWTYTHAKSQSKIPKVWVAIVIVNPLIGLLAYRIIVWKKTESSPYKHKKLLITSISCHIFAIVLFIGIAGQIIVQMM